MREIKFRGLAKDKKTWVYGMYFNIIGDGCLSDLDYYGKRVEKELQFDSHYILQSRLPGYSGWSINDTMMDVKVLKESVGQFTGLTDKNGVEIYEGDIVKHGLEGLSEVAFKDGSFYFTSNTDSCIRHYGMSVCEVIGNIHQNKPLLP
jgi:uncharacterized phage protein (TIGR01671 family)